jgi:hypothetical protein
VNDYCMWIPVVNRFDLLHKAVSSAKDLWDGLTVIDNSSSATNGSQETLPRFGIRPAVFKPCVPLSCSQTFNYMMKETRKRGASICIWMHSDAEAEEGSCLKLLEMARQLNAERKKWGMIFTNYDALSAINNDILDIVGEWDTVLPQYFCDNDLQRRIRLAGYETVESHLPVKHEPSQTLKSDPYRQIINNVTFPLYQHYYTMKWGGSPGNETFLTPFNK